MGDKEMAVAAQAKEVFDTYAHLDVPDLPESCSVNISSLQVQLVRWQSRNFGGATLEQAALGANEEAGELAHAVLKAQQKIRGYDSKSKLRADAGDAIADCAIYLMQAATILRMDFWTLVNETANNVMARDWKAAPETGEWDGHGCPPETSGGLTPGGEAAARVILQSIFNTCGSQTSGTTGYSAVTGPCERKDGHSGACEAPELFRAQVKIDVAMKLTADALALKISEMEGDEQAIVRLGHTVRILKGRNSDLIDQLGATEKECQAADNLLMTAHDKIYTLQCDLRDRDEQLRRAKVTSAAKGVAGAFSTVHENATGIASDKTVCTGAVLNTTDPCALHRGHDGMCLGVVPVHGSKANDMRLRSVVTELIANGVQKYTDLYGSLRAVLEEAGEQASDGKGKERHAGDGEAFVDQQIVQLSEWMGNTGFNIGQACKKSLESTKLPYPRSRLEILGAINYLAGAVIVLDRRYGVEPDRKDNAPKAHRDLDSVIKPFTDTAR